MQTPILVKSNQKRIEAGESKMKLPVRCGAGQQRKDAMLVGEALQDVAELVTPQEQRVREMLFSRLHHLATLTESDVEIMVRMAMQLARFHASHAERVFNLLQCLLETETIPAGRMSIMKLFHGIMLAEGSEMKAPLRKYTPIINKNVLSISHAADGKSGGPVREFLHLCIQEWTRTGACHPDLMMALPAEEENWKYRQPRPTYRAAENSPDVLDLGFLGLKGKALEGALDISALVHQGIAEGQRDGWITMGEDGRLAVHCLG